MKNTASQATATQINNLFAIAQGAPSETARDRAIYALWDIFGDKFLGVVAKKSFQIDSDFSYKGYSPKERQNNLADDAYFVFYKAVMEFDPTRNIPFAAYIAQRGGWLMADEKRKNARRSRREERDELQKSGYNGNTRDDEESLSRVDSCDKNPFTHEAYTIDLSFDGKDLVARIRNKIATVDPGKLRHFDAMYEASQNDKCTDAETGRIMNCTRANVGVSRKKLLQFLVDNGFEDECRLFMAA